MNEKELIASFGPVCEKLLAALSDTLEILASQRRVTIHLRDMRMVQAGDLPETFRGPCVVSRGEIKAETSSGETLLVFRLPDVLIVVGLMYMMDEPQILAKLERGYTDDDADAFGEASSQAYGSMADPLRKATGMPELELRHLQTLEADFGADRDKLRELFPEDWMLRVEFDLQIQGYDPSHGLQFWPLAIVQGLSPVKEVGGASARPSPAAPATPPPARRRTTTGKFDVARVMKLKLPVSVLLARKCMKLGDIFDLSVGSIIEFDKSSEDYLDFVVGNQVIGQGEAGKKGENFCLQVKRVGSPRETIGKLGGRGA